VQFDWLRERIGSDLVDAVIIAVVPAALLRA